MAFDLPLDDWNGDRRSDGVRVVEMPQGSGLWVAMHPDGSLLRRCACCDKLFKTPREAQRNAQFLWPTKTDAADQV